MIQCQGIGFHTYKWAVYKGPWTRIKTPKSPCGTHVPGMDGQKTLGVLSLRK